MKVLHNNNGLALWVCVVLVVGMQLAEAARKCDPKPIERACKKAFFTPFPPSGTCCAALKADKQCHCTYMRNPKYRKLINSPNGRKIVKACGVSHPKC